MFGSIEDLTRMIMLAVYTSLIVFAVTIQGGTSLYYFIRSTHIQAYVEDTLAWIVQLQRSGFSVA